MVIRRVGFVALLALVAACSVAAQPDAVAPGQEPAGEVEPSSPASPLEDGGSSSSGEDAKDAAIDQGKPPNGTPGDILGTLTGSCGIVKSLLTTPTATMERNALGFVATEKYEKASLSLDGQKVFDAPNAGGSSTESEVMSFEVLHACEDAKLLKTETQVLYAAPDDAGASTITDILVEIAGKKVGVSVTRAYKPQNLPFPDAEVKSLIEKKLEGVNRSSVRVTAQDKWVKQILHVFAANKAQADAVERVLPTIDVGIRADTIVLVTQTAGGGFVYCNPDPPLGSECP